MCVSVCVCVCVCVCMYVEQKCKYRCKEVSCLNSSSDKGLLADYIVSSEFLRLTFSHLCSIRVSYILLLFDLCHFADILQNCISILTLFQYLLASATNTLNVIL